MYNYTGLGLEPKLTARRYAREYVGRGSPLCIFGNLKFGEMEFDEMKRNTSNWSNFCMLLRRAGFTASAGLSCSILLQQQRSNPPNVLFNIMFLALICSRFLRYRAFVHALLALLRQQR